MSNNNVTPDSEPTISVPSDNGSKNSLIQIVVALVIVSILAVGTYLFSSALLTDDETVVDETPQLAEATPPENVADEAFMAEKQAEMGGDMFAEVLFDESVGVYLAHPETGQTLYQMREGFCTDECLDEWWPYSVPFEYSAGRVRSVLVNEESNLNYVLLDDKMLFMYAGDVLTEEQSNNSLFKGNGINGVWEIARP